MPSVGIIVEVMMDSSNTSILELSLQVKFFPEGSFYFHRDHITVGTELALEGTASIPNVFSHFFQWSPYVSYLCHPSCREWHRKFLSAETEEWVRPLLWWRCFIGYSFLHRSPRAEIIWQHLLSFSALVQMTRANKACSSPLFRHKCVIK